MKIKFTKTLAIACVLCLALANLTAFADVTTVTSYDVDMTDDTEMTVTTTVSNVAAGAEITYYVSKEDGTIVYIDQDNATDGTVVFDFVAKKGDIFAATAKNGSDKGIEFPTFTFNAGCNYMTNGPANATETEANWAKETTVDGVTGYIFQGKVEGAVTEYGITLNLNGNDETFQAMGCNEDGVFAILVEGITADEAATAVIYAK